MLLADGTEIHTPPHLSERLAAALAPADALTVRGVRTRSGLIVAVAIDPAKGARIEDEGPGTKHERHGPKHGLSPHREPETHSGVIQRLLHGPKGEVHGALLDDGLIVRFAPHAAETFDEILRPEHPLTVTGTTVRSEHGVVIDADAMGEDPAALIEVSEHAEHGRKKPPGKPRPRHHH